MKELTDNQLIDMIISGKDENIAFEYIYKKMYRPVRSFVLSRNGNEPDAEDLLQVTLMKFHEIVLNQNFDRSKSVLGFVFLMAKNKWVDLKRKGGINTKETNDDFEVAADDNTLELASSDISKKFVTQVLEMLGPKCAALLTEFFIHQNSYAEIANRFGFKSADTAKTQVHRCKKSLQELLDKHPKIKEVIRKNL